MSLNIPESNLPRLVIIGGGFAGLSIIKNIDRKEFQVILLDKNNYHTFQPLLYQVATSGLEVGSIAYPLRKFIKHYKIKLRNPNKNLFYIFVSRETF